MLSRDLSQFLHPTSFMTDSLRSPRPQRLSFRRSWGGAIGLAALLLVATPANAEQTDETKTSEHAADADGNRSVGLDMQDRTERRPTPPNGSLLDQGTKPGGKKQSPSFHRDVRVTQGAGMGSATPYAERGVVELGGRMLLDIREDISSFEFGPVFGYFVINNLQLSVLPFLGITHVTDETNWRLGGILEPSYHMGLYDWLYAFVGLGVGASYEDGPGVDALVRPVVGTDIMVGRSGIFKPSIFLDVGLRNGVVAGGFQAAFAIML